MLLRELPARLGSPWIVALRNKDTVGVFVDLKSVLDHVNAVHSPNGVANPFDLAAWHRAG